MIINLSKKGREEVRCFQGNKLITTYINLSWLKSTCYCPLNPFLETADFHVLWALDPWPLQFYLPLPTTGLSCSHKQPWTATSRLTFSALMPMAARFSSGILNFRELPQGDLPDSVSLITWLLSSRNTMSQKYGSLSHAQMKRYLMCSLVSTQKFHPNLTSLFVLWENLRSSHLGCFVKVVTIPGFAHLESEFFFQDISNIFQDIWNMLRKLESSKINSIIEPKHSILPILFLLLPFSYY